MSSLALAMLIAILCYVLTFKSDFDEKDMNMFEASLGVLGVIVILEIIIQNI